MTLRLAVLALAAALPAAQAAVVPAAEQAALLLKVLTADRNLAPRGADGVSVGVVYESASPASREAARTFAEEMRRRSGAGEGPRVRVSLVDASAGELESRVAAAGADVLWVAPVEKLDLAEVVRIAREKRIRTAGSSAAQAEAGLGVAFEQRGGAPSVVVNLEASGAEGADFSAKLLKVARRVGP